MDVLWIGVRLSSTRADALLFLGDADIMIVSIRYIVQAVHDIR